MFKAKVVWPSASKSVQSIATRISGDVWTPLQISGGQPQSKLKTFGAETPLGRPGQRAELAPICVMLAASDAPYITGRIFGASGGTGVPA